MAAGVTFAEQPSESGEMGSLRCAEVLCKLPDSRQTALRLPDTGSRASRSQCSRVSIKVSPLLKCADVISPDGETNEGGDRGTQTDNTRAAHRRGELTLPHRRGTARNSAESRGERPPTTSDAVSQRGATKRGRIVQTGHMRHETAHANCECNTGEHNRTGKGIGEHPRS